MTRLADDPRLPATGSQADLVRALSALLREYAEQINRTTDGRIDAFYSAMTGPPTAGSAQRGDFVRNSAPSVMGPPGSQFVVHGWQCVASGSPGAWVACRFLTGT